MVGRRSTTLSVTKGTGAPAFAYPYLWSPMIEGRREVEEDGKTMRLNTRETVESVKFLTAFWKEAHDEGGLAWDDSNNNRAFLSGTIGATLNGASIYIEALRKPDQYKTDPPSPKRSRFGFGGRAEDGSGLMATCARSTGEALAHLSFFLSSHRKRSFACLRS